MGLISRVSSRTYRGRHSAINIADFSPELKTSKRKMVLDIEAFRPEAGGNPDKVKENQKKRFKSVALVDVVVENDKLWRKARFLLDNSNKTKNIVNKLIGERMKKKMDQGDTDVLP